MSVAAEIDRGCQPNNRLSRASIDGECRSVGAALSSHSDMIRCASAAQTSQM